MTTLTKTNYRGSLSTYEDVKKQISERFGPEVANSYDPNFDARTFKSWFQAGFIVQRGQKSLTSLVIIEKKDSKTGEVIRKYPKRIALFHKLQVSEINPPKS